MQIRRRGCALAGLILFVLSMIPRPALSQLVEISVQLDVLRAGLLDDGCFECLHYDRYYGGGIRHDHGVSGHGPVEQVSMRSGLGRRLFGCGSAHDRCQGVSKAELAGTIPQFEGRVFLRLPVSDGRTTISGSRSSSFLALGHRSPSHGGSKTATD